jgi:transcriptional regulator with XRE-family HTH domain
MEPQTKHMIVVLKATIRGLGFTNREVERRLGVSRGYLTRLFSGVMDLRFDHVSEIAKAIGVDPEDIFRLAYPPTQKPFTPAVQRLRETIGSSSEVSALTASSSPMPLPPPPEPQDGGESSPIGSALEKELERIVARTFKRMFAGLEK